MSAYRKINGEMIPVTTEGHPQYYFDTLAQAEAALSQLPEGADVFVEEGSNARLTDMLHPIGTIIETTVCDTEAKVIETYGGTTWIQHSGYVLRGASSGVVANSATKTGGEDTHTLTIDEMPSHTHKQNEHNHGFSGNSHQMGPVSSTDTWNWCSNVSRTNVFGDEHPSGDAGVTHWSHFNWTDGGAVKGVTATNQNTGGGNAHNNMQSYKDVYIWERTA